MNNESISTEQPKINKIVSKYNQNQLLRFTTAGSVDDGKSTLIGRLLFDSKSIFEDQLKTIQASSKRKGFEYIDLSMLTDGLKSEREQGITIDVAYRYFATPKRKFIIADSPGHIQYTRNMVTGASTASLAIILIDARHGLAEQTHRHSYIASLLKIPHVVVCINKMDLVDYDQIAFEQIVHSYKMLSSKLDIYDIKFIPISALNGDNVVNRSRNMPWYTGPSLLQLLEDVPIDNDFNYIDARFPVQYAIKTQTKSNAEFKGYAGRIAGGIIRVGDIVKILPSGRTSIIKGIFNGNWPITEAYVPMSVTITLEDTLELKRGDMIVKENNPPSSESSFEAMICWVNTTVGKANAPLMMQHCTQLTDCSIEKIEHKLDINTFQNITEVSQLEVNDIAQVKIKTESPILFDSYWRNRITGSFILINKDTNETVAAGMII